MRGLPDGWKRDTILSGSVALHEKSQRLADVEMTAGCNLIPDVSDERFGQGDMNDVFGGHGGLISNHRQGVTRMLCGAMATPTHTAP